MTNITLEPTTTSTIVALPVYTMSNTSTSAYPPAIAAYMKDAAPILYGIGNGTLPFAHELGTEIVNVVTATNSSVQAYEAAAATCRTLAEKGAIVLLSNNKSIDFGFGKQGVFKGLLHETLDAGGRVIVFLATGIDARQWQGLDMDRIFVISTIDPNGRNQKGSVAVAKVRNACVGALATRLFAMQVNKYAAEPKPGVKSEPSGTLDTLLHAHRAGCKSIYILKTESITIVGRNGKPDEVKELANVGLLARGAARIHTLTHRRDVENAF